MSAKLTRRQFGQTVLANTALWKNLKATGQQPDFRRAFKTPPDDSRMVFYYWWFGPSQTELEVGRELLAMQKAGAGGSFIFPVYPLTADDRLNFQYLSDKFLQVLRFTMDRARGSGLSTDLLLGGGWPFGGPTITLERSSRMIQRVREGTAPRKGEELIGVDKQRGIKFVSSPTRQRVKGACLGTEGWVLDHLSREQVDRYLENVGDKLVSGLPPGGLRSINFDSLEAFGQNWTPDFPAQFRKRRGYDLTPHLPALWEDVGEETPHIRHDYWLTITDLFLDSFLKPFHAWCRQRRIPLQGKPMGQPVNDLRAFAHLDLAASEDNQWLQFGGPRWLSSGGRLYNHKVLSNESYCWLRNPRYLASLQDVKVLSDSLFVCGVTAIIAHGFSYSPPETGIPGWSYYASTYFNPKNTWWPYLRYVTKYVQRVSFIVRQGRPVADIALYLPEDDVMANLPAGATFGTKVMVERRLSGAKSDADFRNAIVWSEGLEALLRNRSPLVSTIVTNGYSFDGINNEALQKAAIEGGRLRFGQGNYGVLVLPDITGLPVETMEKICAFSRAGGNVIAIGCTPSLCYGLPGCREKTARIRELSAELFSKTGGGLVAGDAEDSFLKALRKAHPPDIGFQRADPMVGFVHRRSGARDYYFVANMTAEPKSLCGAFRVGHRQPEFWDAITGTTRTCRAYRFVEEATEVSFDLEPYGSIIITFRRSKERAARILRCSESAVPMPVRVDGPWTLEIREARVKLDNLRSWTEDERFRYYSGSGVYHGQFTLKDECLAPGLKLWLHLGDVREIADAEINGRPVGVAWMLPYRLDITSAVRKGKNRISVKVTNLLINRVLGQPYPDVKPLTEKFGAQFSQVPDMLPKYTGKDLKWEQNFEKQRVKLPVLSGLLGPVEIQPRWEG